MSYPTFILGQNNWAVSSSSILGYEYGSLSGQFSPVFLTSSRASTATYVNAAGLIVTASNNISRIDYSTGTGSLLLEPQRTNLALYSEQFDDVYYGKTECTATANTTTAPNGTLTANTITENTNNAIHRIQSPLSVVAGTSYTFSVYAKNNGRRFMLLNANTAFQARSAFDLQLGVISATSAGTAKIESLPNGWYRCSVSGIAATTQTTVIYTQLNNSGVAVDTTYTGDGTSGLFLWGAQLEAGTYATTYIPTGAATATRLADTFNRANMVTNGYIGPSGSTWYVELKNNVDYTRDNAGETLGVGDSTSLAVNSIAIRNGSSSSSRLVIVKRIASVTTTLFTTTTDTVKIAIKWNGTSADVFVNGVKQVSATAFTTTIMEFLQGWGQQVPIFIPSMLLYDYPLPDSELITLTTL